MKTALWEFLQRAFSPNAIARRGYARLIREARRDRDTAKTPFEREFFQWRAELLRDKANYYCQP